MREPGRFSDGGKGERLQPVDSSSLRQEGEQGWRAGHTSNDCLFSMVNRPGEWREWQELARQGGKQ